MQHQLFMIVSLGYEAILGRKSIENGLGEQLRKPGFMKEVVVRLQLRQTSRDTRQVSRVRG
ncbi:hypothetical protein CN09_00660 [Rhizobium rhizogenes]|nr:hypothetical protein CN09_00660 [Rhizobium rhizogenes]MQB34179.1 hypothetical protein [Rhizobium rhizogenes]